MSKMNNPDPVKEILQFNQTLDPRRLKLKFAAMRNAEFAFLRGTCHLFYQNLPGGPVLDRGPLSWISGDLHFENFGSYKGDNRLTYFDLNDFDEACLAPCTWELLRFLSSLITGIGSLGLDRQAGQALCQRFLDAYREQLGEGKPRWIERPLATGLIKDLLNSLKHQKRSRFLDSRTQRNAGKRTLTIDGKKALETPAHEEEEVRSFLNHFAREQKNQNFYQVLHIADRISGLGSLGIKRYVVLVEGRGSPDGNFLLDIKEARFPNPPLFLSTPQPVWKDDADRIVTLQRQLQAIPPALLTPVRIGGRPFVLKELQPSEHRVNLLLGKGKPRRLEKVVTAMGELVAWSQLRSAGWRGASGREQLIDFGRDGLWTQELLELAQQRSGLMRKIWRQYCMAYDASIFDQNTP